MKVREVSGVVGGSLLIALAIIPHALHTNECSPYAATLGINPGSPTPDSPYGITACDHFPGIPVFEGPLALVTLMLCIVGSAALVRVAGFRSVVAVVVTAVAAALVGSLLGFIYSGLGVGELLSDGGVLFSLVVVAVVSAIMASLELRRLPNTSLERTREG